jgi:hypothetical protein
MIDKESINKEICAHFWAGRISNKTLRLDGVSDSIKITFSYLDEAKKEKIFEVKPIKRISFCDLQPIIEFQTNKEILVEKSVLYDFIDEIKSRIFTITIHCTSNKLSLGKHGPLTLKYPYARYLNCVISPDTNQNIIVKLGIYFYNYCTINEIPFGIINYPEGRSLQIIDECFARAKYFVEFNP